MISEFSTKIHRETVMSDTTSVPGFTVKRRQMAVDGQRPVYHFLPPANWINDPHGLIEWQGRYHLFYQYNPNGPFHGTIHWGHAASDDLVHWRDLPIALAPDPQGCDPDGCWSGCMVIDNDLPTIFYTAAFPQTIAAAVSHDEMITWQKLPQNPLIDGPPPDLRPHAGGHFRDPFVWSSDDGWEMLAVSKIRGQGGQVVLYSSPDLRRWKYRGVFLGGDVRQTEPFWQGTMWECPNLLDFGDRQVLLVSVQSTHEDHLYSVYFTGRRLGDKFQPHFSEILVHGGSFYAPQVMRLSDGRSLMFGWLAQGRSQQGCMEAGWNGCHSLPLTLDLLENDTVAVNPARELQVLRGEQYQSDSIRLLGETESRVSRIAGKALEIQATFEPHGHAEFGLKVLCSPDGEEETRIVYRDDSGQIFVERDQSSLDQRADVNPATMPVRLTRDQKLHLHVFIDHSVIEVFANDHLCLATRVYPTRDDSQGVRFFSRQGHTEVSSINIWKMKPVWPVSDK